MDEKEKLALLEETFDVDEGSLAPDMVLEDIDEYINDAKAETPVFWPPHVKC